MSNCCLLFQHLTRKSSSLTPGNLKLPQRCLQLIFRAEKFVLEFWNNQGGKTEYTPQEGTHYLEFKVH